MSQPRAPLGCKDPHPDEEDHQLGAYHCGRNANFHGFKNIFLDLPEKHKNSRGEGVLGSTANLVPTETQSSCAPPGASTSGPATEPLCTAEPVR